MRRARVAVTCVLLSVVGCTNDNGRPVSASPATSRGGILREALDDPGNVDTSAWSGVSVKAVDAGARSVCADVSSHDYPVGDVWERVRTRFPVSTSDADYFTRASVKLYCPRYQREVGEL
ncbi:DUF732 domain-containing protein [Streptomyces sp. NPDC001091]